VWKDANSDPQVTEFLLSYLNLIAAQNAAANKLQAQAIAYCSKAAEERIQGAKFESLEELDSEIDSPAENESQDEVNDSGKRPRSQSFNDEETLNSRNQKIKSSPLVTDVLSANSAQFDNVQDSAKASPAVEQATSQYPVSNDAADSLNAEAQQAQQQHWIRAQVDPNVPIHPQMVMHMQHMAQMNYFHPGAANYFPRPGPGYYPIMNDPQMMRRAMGYMPGQPHVYDGSAVPQPNPQAGNMPQYPQAASTPQYQFVPGYNYVPGAHPDMMRYGYVPPAQNISPRSGPNTTQHQQMHGNVMNNPSAINAQARPNPQTYMQMQGHPAHVPYPPLQVQQQQQQAKNSIPPKPSTDN
jgi:hypothetical protein